MTSGRPFPSIEILGVRVDRIQLASLIVFLRDARTADTPVSVLYLNPHIWNLAKDDPALLAALNEADVVWCDGVGILLAARLLGKRLPARMTVPNFIDEVCRQCVIAAKSLYFLGGEEGVARLAAEVLQRRHPGLKIVGSHHGYIRAPEIEERVVEEIRRLAPDLLLVGMGSPQQELWIARNLHGLNVKVGWAVGALFDHLSGKVPRAPQWASAHGLEWLHRLMVEPRRLWRRYLLGNARFFAAVIVARQSVSRAREPCSWSG